MPITLAKVVEDLSEDLSGFMSKVGMTEESLHSPIRDAVPAAGGVLADPTEVTDADVATVTSYPRLRIFATLFTIRRIWGKWAEVDQKDGDVDQKLNQLGDRLEKKEKAILEELKDPELTELISVVETPPVIGTIKAGETSPLFPFNPYL
jgi:hypothetical protein